jgi:CubicO group peptidase (beta-lactamase class C family)/D-alanyl-D-alanine dipeptidase
MHRLVAGLVIVVASLLLVLVSDVPAKAQTEILPPEKYQAAVQKLEGWIAREVKAKRLPSLALALVDDQEVVWARGFGWADEAAGQPATAETLYRVGSVSKPFTALLVMLLVQLGLLDLDAPVSRYLPDFRPKNQFDKELTLRQMLAHRSGLVRESPVGNYFDDTHPTLAETVKSLNGIPLVFRPESKTSYSNAAVATVGRVVEKTAKGEFAALMQEKILGPLGMTDSSFDPTPAQRKKVAKALMWTYHGREFPAPTFDMGMAPAGSLYSSASDMAKFLKFLFARGQGPKGHILKKETLESMWVRRYGKSDEKQGFGIGFLVSKFEGKRRIGHGGAVYGFSTELAALPDDKLGIIVMSSRDVSNAVTRHIADVALRFMLAVRAGKPLPEIDETRPLSAKLVRKLVGRYQAKDKVFELTAGNGRLYIWPLWVGTRVEVRQDKKGLITDDLLGYGTRLDLKGDTIILDKKEFQRVAEKKPGPSPEKWAGLIGEYGWDHNILYILEKDGKLHALIEWTFLYPLEEINENEFRFPDFGLYMGDKLVFTRDGNGRATQVDSGSVIFKRRPIKGEDGKTFTITPARPLDELRKIALAAKPPVVSGRFRKPELVELTALDPSIKLDVRYATKNNFLQTPFYTSARAYLQRPAAEALVRVHKQLAKDGYGLLIFDAYRPWHVTKMFWDATPPKYHDFVANPSTGSRHNRGCAVDLGLFDLKTGQPVPVVSGFDEFSDRAYPDYLGGTSLQRWHRDLLRRTMEAEGFRVYEAEWWHFDYRDWRAYPILNLTFEELQRGEPKKDKGP